MCPRAMMMSRAWCEVRDLRTLAEAGALGPYQRRLTHAGTRALIELERARGEKAREDIDAAKNRSTSPSQRASPTYSGKWPFGQ